MIEFLIILFKSLIDLICETHEIQVKTFDAFTEGERRETRVVTTSPEPLFISSNYKVNCGSRCTNLSFLFSSLFVLLYVP